MKITIVGAGPVGLLLACLLSSEHTVTIFEKRSASTRNHNLSINEETIRKISDYATAKKLTNLNRLLLSWSQRSQFQRNNSGSNESISTVEIETALAEITEELGVKIERNITIESLDQLKDSIIIGADGARSKIRQLVFNNETTDRYEVQYMAQMKYQTPGAARPRKKISAMSYSFLNGLSGPDMVIDFESLAPPNDSLRKPGTLHIPIPKSVYDLLSANGRGTFATPWSLEELSRHHDPQIAKLYRILKRYGFSLSLRNGWLEEPKVTVIPLAIYRSTEVVKIIENNLILDGQDSPTLMSQLFILVGDASSGLIYERGLNKGWLEAVQCAETLSRISVDTLPIKLAQYSQYCITLYEEERDTALAKHTKIVSANYSTSMTGLVLTSGIGMLLAKWMSH